MAVKRLSKKIYIQRRRRRVREVFITEGLAPREIAVRLVGEGVIETRDESFESAIRIVRGDMAVIRAEIDSDRAEDEQKKAGSTRLDAIERELGRLRKEQRRQELIAGGELGANGKEATQMSAVKTPNGAIVTIKPKWPAGVRQRASKDAALLASAIGKLESQIATVRGGAEEKAADRAADGAEPFRIVMTGKPLNDLISESIDSDKTDEVN